MDELPKVDNFIEPGPRDLEVLFDKMGKLAVRRGRACRNHPLGRWLLRAELGPYALKEAERFALGGVSGVRNLTVIFRPIDITACSQGTEARAILRYGHHSPICSESIALRPVSSPDNPHEYESIAVHRQRSWRTLELGGLLSDRTLLNEEYAAFLRLMNDSDQQGVYSKKWPRQ